MMRLAQSKSLRSIGRAYGIQIGIILLAALWLVLVASTWSEAADAPPADDYSFKWLDPEKKIYVLQNRKYTKAEHAMVSVLAGPGFSNPYRSTFSVEPRFAYYFSESWAFEAFFNKTFNSANNTYKSLQSTNSPIQPVVREIDSGYGGLIQWVPWYAKINVFNQILYFDWYFSGGAGMVKTNLSAVNNSQTVTVSQDEFAMFFGTGHLYHVSQSFLVRLDFNGAFYRSPISLTNGTPGEKAWYSNYNIEIGIGLKL